MEMNPLNAIHKYTSAKPATDPAEGSSIGGAMRDTAMDFAKTLAEAEETAKSAMIGGADPHALVQALAQTELAVETAVTVRNRVVEAYQEILRMPV